MQKLDLSKKRIIVLAHVLTTVPSEDLKEFLLQAQTRDVLYITHPLYYRNDRAGSTLERYADGNTVQYRQRKNKKTNILISYVIHALLSVYWVLSSPGKWDTIICLDNLNCFTGLILRRLHKVNQVVYYSIDFTPQRFQNVYLNRFYHTIEKICVEKSDITWNVSPRIAEGRKTLLGMSHAKYSKQITVPIGVWTERIPRIKEANAFSHTIVYAGSLSPHQGIQLMLDAIPHIVTKIPDFRFKIIGTGEFEGTLRELAAQLDITQYVEFLGYFEKHEDVNKQLVGCAASIAMYNEELSKWSYYADPSKIKSYLACGLPVITTSLTYIAPILEEKKCGIIIPYVKNDLAEAIIRLLTDTKLQRIYRENAKKYSKEFDWNKIFSDAFISLFEKMN